MKHTLLALVMMFCGLPGAQAQSQKLTLNDNEDLVPIINAAAEAGGTYNVTFSDRPVIMDNWDMLCLPFDIRPAEIVNVLGYVAVVQLIENNEDGNIHFEPTVSGTIPAGTPFILNVSKGKRTPTDFKKVTFKNVTLKKVESSYTVTDTSGNRFVSTFSPVELSGSQIFYMSEGNWYAAEEPVTLKPLRCYIDVSGNTTVEEPQIVIDDPTDIGAVTFSAGEFSMQGGQDNAWYTLTGSRLTEKPTSKGIYIHQGRKVIIR